MILTVIGALVVAGVIALGLGAIAYIAKHNVTRGRKRK